MTPQSHSWHISRGKYDLKGYMHPSVHCCTVYNSKDMEATEMSIDRGTDKEDEVQTYSAVTKSGIMPFAATWRDLVTHHTEWSKSDREGEISYDIPYMWTLERNDINEPIYNTERDSDLENELMVAEGGGKGIIREFGKVMYTLLYLKGIAHKNILY